MAIPRAGWVETVLVRLNKVKVPERPDCTLIVLAAIPMLCVILLVLVTVSFFLSPGPPQDMVFRPSEPIQRDGFIDPAARIRLYEYLEAHPEVPGVSLPNLRIHKQFAYLRFEDGTIREFSNPTYEPDEDSAIVFTKETSLMCQDEVLPYVASRFNVILATFYILEYKRLKRVQDMILIGNDAIVYQHMVDVFRGVWMCKHDTEPWTPKVAKMLPE